MNVASFDVFDTVLTRAVAPPAALFHHLARELRAAGLIDVEPSDYARARLDADRRCFQRHGRDSHVDLAAIHRELGHALDLPSAAVEESVATELSLEERALRPLASGRRLVERARERGMRVLFLSDTYLPGAFLEARLRDHGLFEDGDHLYASCDVAAAKRTGRLFDHVLEAEGLGPDELTHLGNDEAADVLPAHERGIRALLVDDGNPTPYEQALIDADDRVSPFVGRLAGAARAARSEGGSRGRDAAIQRVAAGVAAPMLISYVLWLLERSQQLGLRRLCFLSRDGQVLHDIARVLVDRLQITDVDVRYVHASRQAWNLAALDAPLAAHAPWLFSHVHGASTRGLLERVGLAPEDVGDQLAALRLSSGDVDEPLAQRDVQRLIEAIASGPIGQRALIASKDHRELTLAYLRQVGLLGDEPVGVVDVVGRGSQFRAVRQVALAQGLVPPTGMLVGWQRGLDGDARELGDVETWWYDEVGGHGMPAFEGMNAMLLAFCVADHGTVLTYEPHDDRVEPVLAAPDNPPLSRWGLATYRRAVMATVEALWLDEHTTVAEDVRPALAAAAREFWDRPLRDDAIVWGAFPFEYGSGRDPQHAPLAPQAEVGQVLTGGAPGEWFQWRAGAVARASGAVRAAHALRRSAGTLRRRLGR